MPQIIRPQVTGKISIEMSIEDAHLLADSLNLILQSASPDWVGKTLRDVSDGQTCDQFLQALKKTVG